MAILHLGRSYDSAAGSPGSGSYIRRCRIACNRYTSSEKPHGMNARAKVQLHLADCTAEQARSAHVGTQSPEASFRHRNLLMAPSSGCRARRSLWRFPTHAASDLQFSRYEAVATPVSASACRWFRCVWFCECNDVLHNLRTCMYDEGKIITTLQDIFRSIAHACRYVWSLSISIHVRTLSPWPWLRYARFYSTYCKYRNRMPVYNTWSL